MFMTACSVVRRTYATVAASQSKDGKPLRRWRKRLHSSWVALLHSKTCGKWYTSLDAAAMRPFLSIYPSLPLKPLKPYLSLDLSVDERARVIQNSLSLLASHWDSFQHILIGQKPVVATIELGAESKATLCLEYNAQKEGELTLLLRAADGRIAAMSAFAFDNTPDGDSVMRIARIQGVKDHELLRGLEKTMHGLRPKSLMLFASQEVAHALNATAIYGVSNTNQVFNKKVLIPLAGLHKKMPFDYDAFWIEAGGRLGPDGWFCLPLRLEKRDAAEMKPNKRSMYRKRYAMLDEVSEQMHRALNPSFSHRSSLA